MLDSRALMSKCHKEKLSNEAATLRFQKITLYRLPPLGGVHKLRLPEEGGRWSKKSSFCKLLYHRKCKGRGVGGQKKLNFVNIINACQIQEDVLLKLNVPQFCFILF